MKQKQTIKKINEIKASSLKRSTKSDNLLAKLIKKKRERAHINKIRNENEVTMDTTEIQRIIKDYNKQLYANIMDNLEKYNLPRLNEDEIEKMNGPKQVLKLKLKLI